jgi:hypothetical protein
MECLFFQALADLDPQEETTDGGRDREEEDLSSRVHHSSGLVDKLQSTKHGEIRES